MSFRERCQDANLIRWTVENRMLFSLLVGGMVLGIILLTCVPLVFVSGDVWVLSFLPMPVGFTVLFNFIYSFVGRKMDKVRAGLRPGAELQSDCLMVRGAIQSPGVAQVRDGRLLLTPMVGEPVELAIQDLTFEEKRGRFNGSGYPGQTGFWLSGPGISWRLGFMPLDGPAWREALSG